MERQRERSLRRADAVVVVRQADKPSGETASAVAMQVTTLNVKVHGVFAGKDGRVVIRAADKVEAGKIAAGLKKVQVISSGKRLPRVSLYGTGRSSDIWTFRNYETMGRLYDLLGIIC